MRDAQIESVSLQEAHENFADLVKLVAQRGKRIEITHPLGDVVLMSKIELESLERALSIMAETDEFKAIAHSLNAIAAATEEPAVA